MTECRVAVIGAGAWGVNHVRAFARLRGAQVAVVCDASAEARARAQSLAPGARAEAEPAAVLAAPDVDAVVLATPAVTHARLALESLAAGKHVFVEKPLALSSADAAAVVAAAEAAGRVLMVGHLMLYHPGVERLRRMVRDGELGTLHYLYAQRVNLGRLRRDENALWSLAPHDVSMILALLDEQPASVSARGGCYLQRGIEDVVFVTLRFPSGLLASIQLSWLDPRKERRLTVVGSKKMVEFDDVHPVEKLRIYDKGYDRPPEFTEYAEYLSIRNGDIHIPQLAMTEPLELECRHFIECVRSGRRPLTDGASALAVVRVLEAAQCSLAADGAPVGLHGAPGAG
jgi:predicted dehydrogenase